MDLPQMSLQILQLLSLLVATSVAASSSTISSAAPTGTVCPPPAAYEFSIRNVSLANGAVRRGVAVSIGSPGQPLAFQPSCELNNTYLFDNTTQSNLGRCSANETVECYTQLGGLFNEAASSSWSLARNSSALTTASENLPLINPKHNTDLWATDVFTVTPSINISHFLLGVSRGAGETMNTLGLGRNSTLLNTLVDQGSIAARAWGFWQGYTGDPQYQMDGNVVLGGYDMNKISGRNITLPTSTPDDLNTDCFIATVTDIKMGLKNGSSLSLFGPNRATAERACVEPHFNLLSLSQNLWKAFLEISGSAYVDRSTSVIAFYGMLIEADGAYDGNLTISLDPGLDITIPNHQLVVPEYDIDSNGETYVRNDSNREVLINSLQQINGNDMLVLGLPFFTSAYMMVDNDRKQFTLWEANPTTSSNLVAMPPPDCINATATAAAPSQMSTSSATPTNTPILPVATNHATVSKSTIAGAVVGCLAGIALFFSAFLFLKKRRNKAEDIHDNDKDSRPVSPILYKPELAVNRPPPQEMPLIQDTSYALAPYEMSEDRAHAELPTSSFAASMHEMPGVATPRQNEFELSGLPSSPRPLGNNSAQATNVF